MFENYCCIRLSSRLQLLNVPLFFFELLFLFVDCCEGSGRLPDPRLVDQQTATNMK